MSTLDAEKSAVTVDHQEDLGYESHEKDEGIHHESGAVKEAIGNETYLKALESEKPRRFAGYMIVLYLSCLIGFFNSTMNGFDGSLMNALLSNDQFKQFFGSSNVGIKAGIISGMYQIGGVVALPFVGPAVDTWGRRVGMMIGGVIIIVGTVIAGTTISSGSLGQFLAGRFFLGFGISISASAGPLYVLEVSHPAYRGILTGTYNTFYFTGSILASGVVRGALSRNSNQSWLIPLWMQCLFPGIVLVFALLLPESPRWQFAHNKKEQATATLVKYHGGGNPNSLWVNIQLREYEEYLRLDGSDKRWWDYRALFRNRASIYRLSCNVVVSIFGQWSGNGVVSYYLAGVLDTAGIHNPVTQLNINLGIACASFAAALAGAQVVDIMGRRRMLLLVNVGVALMWLGVVVCTGVYANDGSQGAAKGTIAFIFIFSVVYSSGWTPLQALFPVEVLSYEMRAKGMAFSSLAVNAAGLLNQFAWPVALENIKWKTYIVFMIWCFCQAVIIYFLIPETKGRTLEELDDIFESPNPVKTSLQKTTVHLEKGHEGEAMGQSAATDSDMV